MQGKLVHVPATEERALTNFFVAFGSKRHNWHFITRRIGGAALILSCVPCSTSLHGSCSSQSLLYSFLMAHHDRPTNEGAQSVIKSIGSCNHSRNLLKHLASTHTWYVTLRPMCRWCTDTLAKGTRRGRGRTGKIVPCSRYRRCCDG